MKDKLKMKINLTPNFTAMVTAHLFIYLFNSMPRYMVILHALHNLNISFTIL